MKKCAKCGACTVVCPVYKASGRECFSARGKNHLLEVYDNKDHSPAFEDIFAKCLLCGACNKVCPRGIDITAQVMATRAQFSEVYGAHGYEKFLARKVLEKPSLLHGARFFGNIATSLFWGTLPMDSGLRLRLAMFDGDIGQLLPRKGKKQSNKSEAVGKPVVYFPGCSSAYLYPQSIDRLEKLMISLGYQLTVPPGLACCGLALEAAGDSAAAARCAKTNIAQLEKFDGPVLVSCGSCWAHLKNTPHLFAKDDPYHERAEGLVKRLQEISVFLLESLTDAEIGVSGQTEVEPFRVFYHDPCHLRNENSVTAEPRKLLNILPGLELLELEDGPQCCGQGGLFHLGAPQLSAIIRDDLSTKVLALEPDVITTSCTGCYMQWKTALAAAGSKVRLLFLAELVQERLHECIVSNSKIYSGEMEATVAE